MQYFFFSYWDVVTVFIIPTDNSWCNKADPSRAVKTFWTCSWASHCSSRGNTVILCPLFKYLLSPYDLWRCKILFSTWIYTYFLTRWPRLYNSPQNIHMVHLFNCSSAFVWVFHIPFLFYAPLVPRGQLIVLLLFIFLFYFFLMNYCGVCVVSWVVCTHFAVCTSAQMLMQLKNLALEAETELERQDEVLDVLTSSTDRATMSIDKHTCRMRRLL